MTSARRYGTMDPMGSGRVFTDETLREVPAGSPEAAFSWKRSELEARRARRAELGLDKGDEALRVQIDSRRAELVKAEARAAAAAQELEALRAGLPADVPAAPDSTAELRAELESLRAELDALRNDAAAGRKRN